MEYGFQQLVLLNSADYQRAELPLDDSVSLIAPNNTGKTSLINALQFLLIIDRRRMDFGAHEFDKTRRFYFPSNSSYILMEVSLPQSGTVVLGCVGKGVSHDYEYFAYQGGLITEDFRQEDGSLVTQPRLITHLAQKNRTLFRYNATEFRDLIYGGRRTRNSHEPDFTVFRLEHNSDAQPFQQVLTRTLRLDKLSSTDVKSYLLQIFKRDLPDANIDFKQEWDKAFAEVNAERAQFLAAKNQLNAINKLAEQVEARLVLRGKLIAWCPKINNALAQWQQHYQQEEEQIQIQLSKLQEEQKRQFTKGQELAGQRVMLDQALTELKNKSQQQEELDNQFALVSSRETLEAALNSAQQKLDHQTTLIGQSHNRSASLIQRDITNRKQALQQLQRQKESLADNLYLQLSKHLPPEQLERLNRALSAQVMTLRPEQFKLNTDTLKSLLEETDTLKLPGLELSLSALTAQHQQLGRQALEEQITDNQQQLQSLQEQLETAQQHDQAKIKKHQLEKEKRTCEEALKQYDILLKLRANQATRADETGTTESALKNVCEQLAQSGQLAQALTDRINQQHLALQHLVNKHKIIDRIKNRRTDTDPQFSYLADMKHHPWLAEPEWPLEQLAQQLETYQTNCKTLLEYNQQIELTLSQLHSSGLTKYQYSETADIELAAIINFSQQLDKEEEALDKKARSAVINVTASLHELRSGLHAFQGKMREFNRLISHRRLSDLKIFKIEAQDETQLVEAIDMLIDTAKGIDSGDTFELFNHGSILDNEQLERAKQLLIDEGNARQGLKIADLFRLVFIVAKNEQQPESFQEIDSAASNGTVLMAKLVTGLAMLHLMQDKRHKTRAICYLDEALALDRHNQKSLIITAQEFGFALIFASPSPLTTARYCVPIHQTNGKNNISKTSWQLLEDLDEDSP
ncbi:MAG: hypothetical protein DRQ61_08060 [Gammaproteobacteria bacterium]|nr:MAG: hypothetical protein DRQ61_08060 [Gammaproteobacteria bacterium]